MKYVFINSIYGISSTGRIIAVECSRLKKEGHKCLVAYGREAKEDENATMLKIGTKFDNYAHALITRLFDMQGLGSKMATKVFLNKLEEYRPDVIWLHNIHGSYINVPLLFQWLKRHPEIKKFWTLHDCWAFTGHCAYFTMAKCEKWKTGCNDCSQLRSYPKTLFIDRSRKNYELKKNAFCGVENMTLITPSDWLADLTRDSFMREYTIKVQNNEVDNNVFRPVRSDFREKNGLDNKYVILGVAGRWEETKGYGDMVKLRQILNDKFVIVMVGVTKKQIAHMPMGMIGIERASDQNELAKIYTAADVFVNPTHQDNYPTVNLEARACGTPVVTYDVGGSPESAGYEHIVCEGDIEGMKNEILKIVGK